MIIHGHLFDFKTKRSLADFTTNNNCNTSIDYDDLSGQTEELIKSYSQSTNEQIELK